MLIRSRQSAALPPDQVVRTGPFRAEQGLNEATSARLHVDQELVDARQAGQVERPGSGGRGEPAACSPRSRQPPPCCRDVLPTREAGPLAAWLVRHPGVEINLPGLGGCLRQGRPYSATVEVCRS